MKENFRDLAQNKSKVEENRDIKNIKMSKGFSSSSKQNPKIIIAKTNEVR